MLCCCVSCSSNLVALRSCLVPSILSKVKSWLQKNLVNCNSGVLKVAYSVKTCYFIPSIQIIAFWVSVVLYLLQFQYKTDINLLFEFPYYSWVGKCYFNGSNQTLSNSNCIEISVHRIVPPSLCFNQLICLNSLK